MLTVKLDPKILGFWIRYVRDSLHWSQEALAEASGINIRTVQRIEVGQPINITSRRALARGLGYENRDVFDDPVFIKELTGILRAKQSSPQDDLLEQHLPDQMRVKIERVKNGETLGRLIGSSNATAFHADDELSRKAKRVAATLFEYIRDMIELYHDTSFSERLIIHNELETLLKELKNFGATAYSALRTTKTVGNNGENRPPMSVTIGYLTIVPVEKDMKEMIVPRRIS